MFATDNGVIYDVSFAEDNPIGDAETFQFSVVSTNHNRPPFDPYVKQVIFSILEEFFNKNASVILYVCDTSDKRQVLRSRHFQRWFEGYERKEEYVTLSGCIMDEEVENYASIIVQKTNPKLEDIIKDFNKIIEMFSGTKP